jgi:hypothetical protein
VVQLVDVEALGACDAFLVGHGVRLAIGPQGGRLGPRGTASTKPKRPIGVLAGHGATLTVVEDRGGAYFVAAELRQGLLST